MSCFTDVYTNLIIKGRVTIEDMEKLRCDEFAYFQAVSKWRRAAPNSFELGYMGGFYIFFFVGH